MAPAPSTTATLSSYSEIIDYVVNQGHGVKGISELHLKTLPEHFVHPSDHTNFAVENISNDSIPIIDMSNVDDPAVADAICDAAENWGFFQIVNHGIPVEVLESMKAATYRFFELPAEEKKKYYKGNSPSNNVRLTSSFVPEAEKALEWKDYLSLLYKDEDEAARLWPPVCREEALAYMKGSEAFTKRLLKVLLKRLNVNQIGERERDLLMGSLRINMNYYPICPNPEQTVGVGPHSDVSTFTILLQDDVGGLFVRSSTDRSWISVRPLMGSLVINVGDALQIMSNGRYRSVEHRVVASRAKNRISIPLFVNPVPSAVIGPLPEVVADGQAAVYKEVVYSDYVKNFYRNPHEGKKTIEFAQI